MKRFFVLACLILIIAGFPSYAFSRTPVQPSPTPTSEINSFELFWPLVAGRTMQSKIYFLKLLKERIREFFTFGSANKANYAILIGTKRILEAESLIKSNQQDLANKTINLADEEIKKAKELLTNAKNSSDISQGTKDEIKSRVENLKLFLNSISNKYPNYKEKIKGLINDLNDIDI